VDVCLRSPALGYALIWGISANRDRWWSLAAGAELGYQPQQDAGQYPIPDGSGEVPLGLVGGSFTLPDQGIDEIAAKESR
jgi:uronate dehydrogenase